MEQQKECKQKAEAGVTRRTSSRRKYTLFVGLKVTHRVSLGLGGAKDR